jgi:CRP-like cAMP-binding protein
MRDADPILMRRILSLRQFPMFMHADIGELVVVAENIIERTFQASEAVDGDFLHFVVDGVLASGDRQVRAREVHGVLDALANRPAPPTIALVPSHTFALDGADYLDVLEDNFGLLLATMRDLAANVAFTATRSELPHVDDTKLGLVERLIVLRQQFPLEAARLETLSILAHAATEARFSAGATMRAPGSPADALVILSGTVHAGDRVLGPGDSLGFVEALAGSRYAEPVEAVTAVRVLETRAATILDVLEDHTDLGLSILRALAMRSVCAGCSPRAELAHDRAG